MTLYLMRKGQASMTQRVTSMNLTPAGVKGGQVQTMWRRMAAASSSFKYICVWVFRAQHTCMHMEEPDMALTRVTSHCSTTGKLTVLT